MLIVAIRGAAASGITRESRVGGGHLEVDNVLWGRTPKFLFLFFGLPQVSYGGGGHVPSSVFAPLAAANYKTYQA